MYHTEVHEELKSRLISSLGLTATNFILVDEVFMKIDFRDFIKRVDSGTSPYTAPFVLIDYGPATPAGEAMGLIEMDLPVILTYVGHTRAIAETMIPTGIASATQVVASAANMFVGQRLSFYTLGTERRINAIAGTTLTLDATITTTNSMPLRSRSDWDVRDKMEIVAREFRSGRMFSNFQVMMDPQYESGVDSTLNEKFFQEKFPYIAASVDLVLRVGEIDAA